MMATTVAAEEAAELLLRGLDPATGSSVGAKVFADAFKKKCPSYFTEVTKQAEKIMHQQLTNTAMARVDRELNRLINWVRHEYIHRKESQALKPNLFAILEPRAIRAAAMTRDLSSEEFGGAALAVFVISASVHLSLLQEMAIVDPEVNDPVKSSHVATLEQYAREYSEHATRVWMRIKRVRETLVTPLRQWRIHIHGIPGPVILASWRDDLTGQTFRETQGQITCAERSRTKHIAKSVTEIGKRLNEPMKAVSVWKALIREPGQ